MAWHSILYNVLLVTCVPYALLRGGAPERWCAAVAFLATLLSILALSRSAIVYQDAETGTLIVDGLSLGAFFGVALFADRFWPMLVAGLQADAVIIHICKLVEPDMLPLGYAIGLSIWSYPVLILLAIGTARHQRRLAAHGSDPAWSAGRQPGAVRGNGPARGRPIDRSGGEMRRTSNGGLR